MNAMKEFHLTIETLIDGERVANQEIHDPFLHTKTVCKPSLWERIKFLWTGQVVFEVKIQGDDEVHRQWFRTDKLPRGEHERETSQAMQAIQNAADGERSSPADGSEH